MSRSTLSCGHFSRRVAVPGSVPTSDDWPQPAGTSSHTPVQVSCEGLWAGRHWHRHVQDKHLWFCNGRGGGGGDGKEDRGRERREGEV